MGFQNENSNQVTWANIANGKVVLKSKTQLDGYIPRINKLGNQVFEQFWDRFDGKLVNVRTNDGEYGLQWFFEFEDDDNTVIITVNYDNRNARTFLNRLLNKTIDFNKKIAIKPYSFLKDDGQKSTGVTIFQDGKKIEPRFTYEELPKPQEIKVKKQITYNYTEQMEFLESFIQKEVLPKLSGGRLPNITIDAINIESDINKEEEDIDFFKDFAD